MTKRRGSWAIAAASLAMLFISASPALGDLNEDGDLEIVVPSLDQHLYVWDGSGNPMPGFPKKLRDPAIPGAEIITTAALGDVSGDGKVDIVTPTQEFDDNPSAPETPGGGATIIVRLPAAGAA